MTIASATLNITTMDHRLMRRVHEWRAPRWVRWWMLAATRCGDGWLWAASGALLLAIGGRNSLRAFEAALIAVFAGILLFLAVKKAVRRPRPCALMPHCWATLLPPDQFSFPSGHTITAFAVAVPLACCYPPAAPPLLFCAASVAASRVLLGMHFLSDVVAGALIGAGLGYLALAIL